MIFNTLQQLIGELLPHAWQLEQVAGPGRFLELVDVGDLERRPE